jgi:hypothetical protein
MEDIHRIKNNILVKIQRGNPIHWSGSEKEIIDGLGTTDLSEIYQIIDESLSSLKLSDIYQKFSQDLVQAMVDREIELRKSKYYMDLMKSTENSGTQDWMDIIEQLQRQVVQEFGFHDLERGLLVLRTASQVYDLERPPFYVTFNRAREGNLKVGDLAPNPMVYKIDQNQCKLYQESDQRIQFIFAGAVS